MIYLGDDFSRIDKDAYSTSPNYMTDQEDVLDTDDIFDRMTEEENMSMLEKGNIQPRDL